MNGMSGYFMDDPREGARLVAKVDADRWVDEYVLPRLSENAKVLDVGCGPGAICAAVERAMPGANVTGIDLSGSRIEERREALPPSVRLIQGDATAMPLEDESFDFVYSRFLLEYLPRKEAAVQEMVRVCKPGGQVLLQDLDGQLLWHFPEDPRLQSDLNRVLAGLAETGFDPFVGRKLFSLARGAGLVDLAVAAQSYHLIAGRADARTFALWDSKLRIAVPAATRILGSREAAEALRERFLAYLQDDGTLTWSVAFTVVGRRPSTDA